MNSLLDIKQDLLVVPDGETIASNQAIKQSSNQAIKQSSNQHWIFPYFHCSPLYFIVFLSFIQGFALSLCAAFILCCTFVHSPPCYANRLLLTAYCFH
ncbi:TPA: hypothetical protein I8Y58_002522 [Legionella pneumophila]|uniref:Uncharacterized protein n=1 Tax=Legionella pneumophila TaxID=446 RepID=A0AAN5R611_LEGPN|nr:hypothetical protein [Legionella pneumophila]